MKVVFVPYWVSNPYQDALGKSLESFGVTVSRDSLNDVFHSVISRRSKVDIVHLHWLPPVNFRPLSFCKLISFIFKLSLLRNFGVKIVWTVHNLKHHESGSPRANLFLAKNVASLAHAVIVHSVSAKDKVYFTFKIKNYFKIFVIPHGNYIAQYENSIGRASARLHLGVSDSAFVALFFGRIRPYKGAFQLIDTFKSLKAGGLDTELIIAGLPLNDDFSKSIREKIRDSAGVQFKAGFVPANEVQVYMNACDVTVFPYDEILTSGSVILAMSFAQACVAPKLGFITDILDDAGAFLYDAADNNGLLNALKAAYDNREKLVSMGQHNRQKVLPWTWDYVASGTYKVYLECARK